MFPICDPFELYRTIELINSTCEHHNITHVFDEYIRNRSNQLYNLDKKIINIHLYTLVHYGWTLFSQKRNKNQTFVAKIEIPDWTF
jgi:hypothetical protein